MPITSINGLYNGFLVKYTDKHLQELINLSNFELQGGEITNNYVYFPSPTKLQEYGIDHSNRPYRVFLLENNLIVPEFFSFDCVNWYSTFYSKIPKDQVKTMMLQGITRTYDLLKDGSFYIVPSISMNNTAIKVYFNGEPMLGANIYPFMKYQVETQSIGFSDGSSGTQNRGVDLGWRVIQGKYDISVLLFVDALENAISFKAMVSDAKTKKPIATKETFDHKAHIYHIKSKD